MIDFEIPHTYEELIFRIRDFAFKNYGGLDFPVKWDEEEKILTLTCWFPNLGGAVQVIREFLSYAVPDFTIKLVETETIEVTFVLHYHIVETIEKLMEEDK